MAGFSGYIGKLVILNKTCLRLLYTLINLILYGNTSHISGKNHTMKSADK